MTLYSRACSDACIPRNSKQGGFILTVDCCYKDNCNAVPITNLPPLPTQTPPPPPPPSPLTTSTFCNRNSAVSSAISNSIIYFSILSSIAFILIRNLTN